MFPSTNVVYFEVDVLSESFFAFDLSLLLSYFFNAAYRQMAVTTACC